MSLRPVDFLTRNTFDLDTVFSALLKAKRNRGVYRSSPVPVSIPGRKKRMQTVRTVAAIVVFGFLFPFPTRGATDASAATSSAAAATTTDESERYST
jgi:hypothetical protein